MSSPRQQHKMIWAVVAALLCTCIISANQVAAQADCAASSIDNRGWLQYGADRGVHPTTSFGPLGLHGQHQMLNDFSNSGVSLRVSEVVEGASDGGMTQTGSSTYNPFKVGGNGDLLPISYYPGRKYRITITCEQLCTFLGSVEQGTRDDSFLQTDQDKRAALQVGTIEVSDTAATVLYTGITNYTSITNANDANGAILQSSYSYFWTAPTFAEIGSSRLARTNC